MCIEKTLIPRVLWSDASRPFQAQSEESSLAEIYQGRKIPHIAEASVPPDLFQVTFSSPPDR